MKVQFHLEKSFADIRLHQTECIDVDQCYEGHPRAQGVESIVRAAVYLSHHAHIGRTMILCWRIQFLFQARVRTK